MLIHTAERRESGTIITLLKKPEIIKMLQREVDQIALSP